MAAAVADMHKNHLFADLLYRASLIHCYRMRVSAVPAHSRTECISKENYLLRTLAKTAAQTIHTCVIYVFDSYFYIGIILLNTLL